MLLRCSDTKSKENLDDLYLFNSAAAIDFYARKNKQKKKQQPAANVEAGHFFLIDS